MDEPGVRAALLVAADDYKDERISALRGPSADVAALASVLGDESVGRFTVEPVINEPLRTTERALFTFFRNRRTQDVLLVYFSGHGYVSKAGDFYFAMPDTDRDELELTALDADRLLKMMRGCRSRSIVVIADCCYSGTLARHLMPKGQPRELDLRPLETKTGEGNVLLTSSSELQPSYEDPRIELDPVTGGSVFTRLLVEGLRTGEADEDNNGHISVDELYRWVARRLEHESEYQRATQVGRLRGEVVIGLAPQPVLLPADILDLTIAESSDARRYAIERMGDLLTGPDEELRRLARDQLDNLTRDPDDSVARNAQAALDGRPLLPSAPPAGSRGPSARVSQLLGRGERLRQARGPEAALTAYDAAVAADPDDSSARVERASALRELRRFDEAHGDLDRAVSRDPENVAARVARGDLLVALGRPEDALVDLDESLRLEPSSLDARTSRGRAFAAMQPPRRDEARAEFLRVIDVDLHPVDALIGLSGVVDPEKARAVINRAISLEPTSVDARLASAELHLANGASARAEADLKKAMRKDPGDLRVLMLLGGVRLGEDDLTGALAFYKRAIAAAPESASAHYWRGHILSLLERHEEALEEYRLMGELRPIPGYWQPDAATLARRRAETLLELERDEEAVEAADAAARLRPDDPGLLILRAKAVLAAKRPGDALADIGRALAIDGDLEPKVRSLRDRALLALGDSLDEGCPDGIREMVEAGRTKVERELETVDLRRGIPPDLRRAIAERTLPGAELVWIGRWKRFKEPTPRLLQLFTTGQMIWCQEWPLGLVETKQVPWRDVGTCQRDRDGLTFRFFTGGQADFRDVLVANTTFAGETIDVRRVGELAGKLIAAARESAGAQSAV